MKRYLHVHTSRTTHDLCIKIKGHTRIKLKTLNFYTYSIYQSNIILMGAPGAGKTVVARELGALLKMKVIDVDDHVLEPSWGMSVAEKV